MYGKLCRRKNRTCGLGSGLGIFFYRTLKTVFLLASQPMLMFNTSPLRQKDKVGLLLLDAICLPHVYGVRMSSLRSRRPSGCEYYSASMSVDFLRARSQGGMVRAGFSHLLTSHFIGLPTSIEWELPSRCYLRIVQEQPVCSAMMM